MDYVDPETMELKPTEAVPAPDVGDIMEEFWLELAEWQRKTFGPDAVRGPKGPLKHLLKEIEKELLPFIDHGNRGELVEYADLLFLVFDATRRAGFTYRQLVNACFDKLEINKAREWPPFDPAKVEEAVEHKRD